MIHYICKNICQILPEYMKADMILMPEEMPQVFEELFPLMAHIY